MDFHRQDVPAGNQIRTGDLELMHRVLRGAGPVLRGRRERQFPVRQVVAQVGGR